MVPNVYHLQQHRLGSTYATCTTRRIAEPVSSTRRQIVCNVLKLQFLPGKLPLIVLTPRQSRQIRSKALSTPATMSNEFIVKFRSFDKVEKNEQVHFFRLCRNNFARHCCHKRQQCGSNNQLCRKNRSTCSIRQCCFDIVAGMDGA